MMAQITIKQDNQDRPPTNDQDTVITPAGPMPKDKVQHVGPGEMIRRNKDGTYTVVPKTPEH